MRQRKYRRGAIAHIYQRAYKGFILFYSFKDCLLFFTIFSELSRKHDISIAGLCLMQDHIHFLVEAASQKEISSFVSEYSTMYARSFNHAIGRTGHIFRKSYGLANKTSDKAKRSAVLYVLNNPVEKKLARLAELWRWNFLMYAESSYPFSHVPILRKASSGFRNAVRIVKMQAASGRHIPIPMLDRIFRTLDADETEQMCDFIISSYNPIDYSAMKVLFGSFESVLTAAKSSTGSEYDIKEEFNSYSDKAYFRIAQYVQEHCSLADPRDVVMLSADDKVRLMNEVLSLGLASGLQVGKYFHVLESSEF